MSKVTSWFKNFWKDEEGLQTLELMLIIAVIVVITLLFRKRIMQWINNLLTFGDTKIQEFQTDGSSSNE